MKQYVIGKGDRKKYGIWAINSNNEDEPPIFETNKKAELFYYCKLKNLDFFSIIFIHIKPNFYTNNYDYERFKRRFKEEERKK